MTLWIAILLACAATYLTKLAGYAVPARWLQNPFAAGTALVVDARLASLAVAALALWLRLPFLVVVLLGAAAAALMRW